MKNNYSRSAFFRRIVSYNKNGEEVSKNMLNFDAALSFEETEFSGKKEKYESRTEKTIIKAELVHKNKKQFVYFYVFKPENKKNNILNINTNSNRSLPGEWIRLQKTTEEVEFYSLMESPNLTSTIESIYFQDHGICSIIFNEGGVTSIKSKFYTFNHNQIFLFTRSTQSTRNEKIFDYYGSSYMNYKITNKKLTISTKSATNEFTIKE